MLCEFEYYKSRHCPLSGDEEIFAKPEKLISQEKIGQKAYRFLTFEDSAPQPEQMHGERRH